MHTIIPSGPAAALPCGMHKSQNRQRGMTLLELTVVLMILVTLATVALRSTAGLQDQAPFEATTRQLTEFHAAVAGDAAASFNDQRLLSGYVVNNGLLPTALADLTSIPTNYDAFGAISAKFDSNSATDGINDGVGAETTLNETRQTLYKGYRGNGYIRLPIGATTSQDGWGNNWDESGTTATTFLPKSLGADNAAGSSGGIYDPDLSDPVFPGDWRLDMAGWSVTVENMSGIDISSSSGPPAQCLRASLLVYINNGNSPADDLNWKRLTSDCIPGNTGTGSCLDGDGDNLVGGNPCPATVSIAFPAAGGGVGAYQPPTDIPQGEHLLVLVSDSDATDAHNDASESVYFRDLDSDATKDADEPYVTTRVQFFARRNPPGTKLTIR